MAKKAKFRRIKSNQFYTPDELAKEVDLSTATIYRHIKDGLPTDRGVIPFKIYGKEAKNYFRVLYDRKKVKTSKEEVCCNRCGAISKIRDTFTTIVSTGYSYNPQKYQAHVRGFCPDCRYHYSRLKPFRKTFVSGREIVRGTPISIDLLTGEGEK